MRIELTKGMSCVIDDADWHLISHLRWYAVKKDDGNWYAIATIRGDGPVRRVRMHRVLLGDLVGDGLEVDHRDGNGLNNQRANLRVCTKAQNAKNRKRGSNNTTGFKGVVRRRDKFEAKIYSNRAYFHLGSFETPEAAHAAYLAAAARLHGEFACSGERNSINS